MRFLLDESADARLADFLVGVGHDVTSIARDHTASIDDLEVLALAAREGRVLITNDKDFGELVFRLGESHAGVILFRIRTTQLETKTERLTDLLREHANQLNEFLVVTERAVRVRRRIDGG